MQCTSCSVEYGLCTPRAEHVMGSACVMLCIVQASRLAGSRACSHTEVKTMVATNGDGNDKLPGWLAPEPAAA
eukprot:1154398-Pelagomonas_calceolata.AAC.2